MALLELQLGCVLDRDNALTARYIAGQHVEQRGLAAARASADEYVRPGHHTGLEEPKRAFAAAAQTNQVLHVQRPTHELADVQERAIDGDGRNRGVNPGTVRQPCVADRVLRID